jgi:hypothetical protein
MLEKDIIYPFNANQWYDYKIVYDKITGITEVYVDDVFIDSWQDVTPLTVGNYVSWRSGNCVYDLDELRIHHSRTAAETILVGAAPTNDIRYDNLSVPSGRINSIVIDTAHNISIMATEMVDVDFTITGVNEHNSNDFLVYPNPTKEQITIKFNQAQTGQLIIRDISGREVITQQFNQMQQISVNVQELSQGVYFLSCKDKVVKLVKE